MDPAAPARRPKVKLCYVCGREYGLSSFEIHLKQCKLLWLAQEEKKPLRERKPLPEPPHEVDAAILYQLSPDELEALNRAAARTFEDKVMEKCAFCGRTFNPERLAIHNRSCTADKPARAVGTARLSAGESSPPPQKPARKPSSPASETSSQGRPSLTASSQGRLSTTSSQGGGRVGTPPAQTTSPQGGGRVGTPPVQTTPSRGGTPPAKLPALAVDRPTASSRARTSPPSRPASPVQLAEFQAKLDFWETQALAMVRDIRAMKDMLAQLSA